MMQRFYIILFLLLTGFIYGVQAQTQSQYLTEAANAFESENYAAALEYYSNALEFDEEDITLMYKVAESARLYHSYTLADSLYKMVVEAESDGNYPEASFWRGIVLQAKGDYQGSNDMFNLYLSEHSGEDEYLDKRANKEINANNWAIEMIEYAPENPILERLDEGVNTPYSEFGSYLLNDTLYFSSLRFENEADKNIPARPISKILISVDSMPGIVLDTPNVTELHTAHTTFSKEHDRIYYTICEYITGNEIRCDLYYREVNADGSFGMEVKLPAHINNDSTTSTEPSIGMDPLTGNEVLFFVSDREGGEGMRDIWMTEVIDTTFGDPVNVRSINTAWDDITPQYDFNTKALYFSTEGYLGYGGFDVYASYPTAEGGWTQPENMGPPINSSYNDIYFFMLEDGENGYVSSNRPGSLFLEEDKEACCYDIYKAQIPDLEVDLIAETYLASFNEPVTGATVKLYPVHVPALMEERYHPDSFSYRMPLKRNKDYILVAEKENYLPDTIKFSTRKYDDTTDIIKRLNLKTIDLNLLALVFDDVTKQSILGAEVTVIPMDEPDNKDMSINLDNNEFRFSLDRDKSYRVIASRKGYKSQSIVIDASDFPNESQVVEKIYLPIGDLSDFLPLVLYFDNDHPDPDSWRRSTNKIYSETYDPYYERKTQYKDVFSEPLETEESKQMAQRDIERFFETELKKGDEDLGRFLGVLLKSLEEGVPVNIFIKGYTSPRYSKAYNYALGLRRVAAVKNELRDYQGGALIPYMKSGQLAVTQKSFGELESPEDVIDDLQDKRNSIYSVKASKERRVEIINVDKE